MFKMIANGIEVQMFVGICDFEYKEKQKVMVNVTLQGNPKFAPTHITECMDYSKICNLVHSRKNIKIIKLVDSSIVHLFLNMTILLHLQNNLS